MGKLFITVSVIIIVAASVFLFIYLSMELPNINTQLALVKANEGITDLSEDIENRSFVAWIAEKPETRGKTAVKSSTEIKHEETLKNYEKMREDDKKKEKILTAKKKEIEKRALVCCAMITITVATLFFSFFYNIFKIRENAQKLLEKK